jgi:hypothetical protein
MVMGILGVEQRKGGAQIVQDKAEPRNSMSGPTTLQA